MSLWECKHCGLYNYPVEKQCKACFYYQLQNQIIPHTKPTQIIQKQTSSKIQNFDVQFDLVPVLYCLLNCPALFKTSNQIKLQNKRNNISIIDEIVSLFQTYNDNANSTKKMPSNAWKSIQSKLKSSTNLNLTGTIRNENTAAELMEHLLSVILQESRSDKSCMITVPIPRSIVNMVVTVIHIQPHADPADYNKPDNRYILLLHGFVRHIDKHKNMALDIYQIVLNYIGNTCIPKRYLLKLPSDSRIIDIKLALQKFIQIPIEQYVFCESGYNYSGYGLSTINQWSQVHGLGDSLTDPNSDDSEGFSEYFDHHYCDDPTIWGLPNGNMDVVCYIKPTNKDMRKMFQNATEFRQVEVFHAVETQYGLKGYKQLGIGFYITIPLRYELSVSYISNLINAIIKPYLNGVYKDDELPYTLKLHHVFDGRYSYNDCSYGQMNGCCGCDLYTYMNKYKIINPDRWRLRCFGIHWKTSGETLFQHQLFKNPMNMFDDSAVIENLKKYHTTNKLSMIKKQNDVTLLNCIDEFLDEQSELEKSLRLPEMLVVKMQRFARNSNFRFKYRNKEVVSIPFNGLNLKKYCNHPDDEKESDQCKYDLFAILKCKEPSWKYETYFKDLKDNNWYKLDKEFGMSWIGSIDQMNMSCSPHASMTEYADIVCYARL